MPKEKKPDSNAKSTASEASSGRALSSSIKVLGVLRQGGSTYLVANPAGAPLDRAIRIPAGLLAKANAGQLERFILESGMSCLLSYIDIKDISAQLRKAYTNSSSVVVASPGQHAFVIEGKEHQLLAHNGRFRWLGQAPEHADVTLIGEAALLAKTTKSLDDFNNVFTPIVASSPRLMLVLLVALAAMLVGHLNLPPLAVLLVGRSSTGKSLIQRAVAWWVNGDGHVRMFNGTPKGMQKYLHSQPAKAVFFEDSHGAENAHAVATLIMATGNAADQRLTALVESAASETRIQASLVLSAEESVSRSIRRSGVAMHSGLNARLTEVHTGRYGMFDALGGHQTSADLAHFVNINSPEYAGVIGAAFAKALSGSWEKLPSLWTKHRGKYRRNITEAAGVEELSGINSRLLDQLAVTAFAGQFAIQRDVLTLEMASVYGALGTILREHLARHAEGKTPVATEVIEAVRHFLQVNSAKFDLIHRAEAERSRNGLAGYLKRSKTGELLFLFFPESFKQVLPKGTEAEALQVLAEAGYLAQQPKRGYRFQARFRPFGNGKDGPRISMEFIAVRASILGEDT